ncbi:MAG: LytTR family DNA-binding domain-containing protein [Acidobacteriota bacterium]
MIETIRAIIVDDERLARKELRSLLAAHPEIEVVGEADSVVAAMELIRALEPYVVFLDIQMPGESGFSLFDKIQVNFKVIFVTAFDTYAIRAFEVNALDYLLKPVNPNRLAGAINRLLTGAQQELVNIRKLEYDDRLFVETNERAWFLKLDTIIYLCAVVDYSEIFTADGEKILVPKTLKQWEERLPEKHFLRIHRSIMINLEYIERIEQWSNRSYQIYLRHIATPFTVSRRYAARLKLKFG